MNRLCAAALCFSVFMTFSGAGLAQDAGFPSQASAPAASSLSPQQLDELVAPVALYPDPLLADVLTASTYPLEVVEADRWASDPQNAGLSGDDLTDALSNQDWDPSVKSLIAFPQVLQLLDAHLDWMETLGETFLAQPADVMGAIQQMRARARNAGNLPSDGEETVTDDNGMIAVSPPEDLVYVPEYDPWCAFGDWSSPPVPPYYFSSWSGYCEPEDYAVVFSPGIAWPFSFWDWGYFDWRHHRLLIRPEYYRAFRPDSMPRGNVWQHDSRHRDGVLYRNPRNARAFGQPVARPVSSRGWANAVQSEPRPAPQARNWNSGQAFRAAPRPAMAAGSAYRSSSARPAAGFGRGRGAPGRSHH
ncbi:MAG TPA: DUF3300 domain-containing protein [Rhizomicrobium sp.]|nr:DUF3300 domain-containing protein [Rhizomicrobium sp.]